MSPDAPASAEIDASISALARRLDARLARDATTLALSDHLRFQGTLRDAPMTIDAAAWRSERVAFARLARVDAGDRMQVLNLVIYPSLMHPLPILGCDLLAFKDRLHLFVLDLFPIRATEDPAGDALRADLTAAAAALDPLGARRPAPPWGESVFSKNALFLAPAPGCPLAPLAGALEALVDAYCRALASHSPTPIDPLAVARRRRYLRDHAEEEPTRAYLARSTGDAWAEAFVSELLFPRWLEDGDERPDAREDRAR